MTYAQATPQIMDKTAQIAAAPVTTPMPIVAAPTVAQSVAASPPVVREAPKKYAASFIPGMILATLGLLSLVGIFMFTVKLMTQLRITAMAKKAKTTFEHIKVVREATNLLDSQSPYRMLAESMLDAFHKHGMVSTQISLSGWLSQSVRAAISGLFDLNQTDNTLIKVIAVGAPIIGLFGSVCEISSILIFSGASDIVISPYIGGALVMTIVGVGVSFPLFVGFYFLEKRNKSNLKAFKAFGNDMITLFLATANRMKYKPLGVEQQEARSAAQATLGANQQAQIGSTAAA